MPKSILNTVTPNQLKLEVLRQHFPQAIETDADGRIRINANALQLAIDPSNPAGVQVEEDGFELRWVGKREAYHSAFVPVQKIVDPRPEQSKHWDTTGNVLMKGDNLDALRLLRQSYFGKVKLIYIDPPYNTQSDAFIYRDDFSAKQSDVLTQLGYAKDNIDYIKNIYGARTHSGWLSFMYPRLLLAKDLLRDDGVIFISIDDNEQAHLKLLCDEVFGQENFISTMVWAAGRKNDSRLISVSHEYILCYAGNKANLAAEKIEWFQLKKGLNDIYAQYERLKRAHATDHISMTAQLKSWYKSLPDGHPAKSHKHYRNIDDRGIYFAADISWPGGGGPKYEVLHPITNKPVKIPARGWITPDPEKMQNWINTERIHFGVDETTVPCIKAYLSDQEFQAPYSVFYQDGRAATKRLRTLMGADCFDFPKDEFVLKELVALIASKNDTVVDFFAGSGTTAHAVMQQNAEDGGNRQFILVQIPQPIDAKKQKEAHTFVTQTLSKPEATIFEITAERIRRAGAKIEVELAEKANAAGGLLPTEHPPVDTGFRVFELVDDPDALILQKPLQHASQADVLALQAAIATPQPALLPRVLYNLLLAEGLPLTTALRTVIDEQVYAAANVVFVVQALPLDLLTDTLRALQQEAAPPVYLTVYAPWIADSNFMLGIKTMAETLGYSDDKLRLRG